MPTRIRQRWQRSPEREHHGPWFMTRLDAVTPLDIIDKEITMTVTQSDTMMDTAAPAIRPFRINVAEADLVDLRQGIAATRWPERETVSYSSQGVPLAVIQELAGYWATEYDWRTVEAKLNALPQFSTE